MRGLVLLLGACWTASSPPSRPTTATPTGSCRIRELDLSTQEPVKLRVRGKTFTNLSERLARLEVSVTGKHARAVLETELVELDADLELADLPVRPRFVELRDGWLEITRGVGQEARGDQLRFAVALPDGLSPRSLPFEITCASLTFSEPPSEPDGSPTKAVEVVPGTIAKLRAIPGGPVVANARAKTRGNDVRESYMLERRGAMMRVRFSRPNAVVAWVDAASMRARGEESYGGLMGGLAGDTSNRVWCRQPLPLYVRDPNNKTEPEVRVGQLKAGVIFQPAQYGRNAVDIDLGSETELKAFVKPDDIAKCPSV